MSKNVQFGYAYLSENATAAASTTASNYDAQNVVQVDRAVSWKAGGTSSEWVRLDLGSAKTPTFLGIVGGNWSAWTSVKLQHSPDGSAWTDFLTLSSLPSDSSYDYFALLTAAPSRQYWRLFFTTVSAAPQLECFYLGTAVELTWNPPGQDEDDDFNVHEDEAASGAISAEEFGRRRTTFRMPFAYRPRAHRDQFRTVLRAEGGSKRPFFYVPRDDSGSGAAGQAFLVRHVSRFPNSEEWTDLFNFTAVLREEG